VSVSAKYMGRLKEREGAPPLPAPLAETVPVAMFKSEVAAWARRIGVVPREVHVRPMSRKWASCSSRGRVTFDSELLRQPAAFRAEVVAHELLHLKVPNHGKVFKSLLRAYLRDNGRCSSELREHP
jgi:hypothetical protein